MQMTIVLLYKTTRKLQLQSMQEAYLIAAFALSSN